MTGVNLDLITDLKVLDMIETEKRGGLCLCGSKRHVTANNHYLPDSKPEEEKNYLVYVGANNLYGLAMTQTLPEMI